MLQNVCQACTGCFIWNFAISNGCSTNMVCIWPYVGKAKMCFRSGSFFNVSWSFQQIEIYWWKIQLTLKKTTASQTHFGFTNLGLNMHRFCATAIWNSKISNETPCRNYIILWISFLAKLSQFCHSAFSRNFCR